MWTFIVKFGNEVVLKKLLTRIYKKYNQFNPVD